MMSSIREPFASFSRRLEKTERQLELVVDLARKTNHVVHSLRPQPDLPPIPRPKQRRDFNRSCNVVSWLRQEIDRRNSSLPTEGPRYHQFPDNADDSRIGSDAQKCLEISLMFHLDTEYGQFTWDQEMVGKPKECASNFREARQTPELFVFCQTAGLWGIDMLLKTKVKSKLRTLGQIDAAEGDIAGPVIPETSSQHLTPQNINVQNRNTVRTAIRALGRSASQPTQNVHAASNVRTVTNSEMNCTSGDGRMSSTIGSAHDVAGSAAILATSVQRAAGTLAQPSKGMSRQLSVPAAQAAQTQRESEERLRYERIFPVVVDPRAGTASNSAENDLIRPNQSSNAVLSVQRDRTMMEIRGRTVRGGRRRGRHVRSVRARRN